MKTEIGMIEEEKAACVAAFEAAPEAEFAWCCHHEVHIERLDNWRDRVAFISKNKPVSEQAVRFRNFRPVCRLQTTEAYKARVGAYKAWVEADKAWAEAYKVWAEAYKTWTKAYKTWTKADKAWTKAYKAWTKADKVWVEAFKTWAKAYKAWSEPDKKALHDLDWPDNTWNGRSIFS